MNKIDELPEEQEIKFDKEDLRFPLPVAKLFNKAEVVPEWKKMSSSVDVAQLVTARNCSWCIWKCTIEHDFSIKHTRNTLML